MNLKEKLRELPVSRRERIEKQACQIAYGRRLKGLTQEDINRLVDGTE